MEALADPIEQRSDATCLAIFTQWEKEVGILPPMQQHAQLKTLVRMASQLPETERGPAMTRLVVAIGESHAPKRRELLLDLYTQLQFLPGDQCGTTLAAIEATMRKITEL
jgi:hypothetical protein